MDLKNFRTRLDTATINAVRFASTMVLNQLPAEFRYSIILNASYDDLRLSDEKIYPQDNGVIHKNVEAGDVVHLLFRDGRVPQWIDIAVACTDGQYTHLCLDCCGRYHADDSRLYYNESGIPPFGVKSPILPCNYNKAEKFSLQSMDKFLEMIRRKNSPNTAVS